MHAGMVVRGGTVALVDCIAPWLHKNAILNGFKRMCRKCVAGIISIGGPAEEHALFYCRDYAEECGS